MFNSYYKTMKKKRTGTWFPLKKSRAKILMVMKLTFLLMCGFVFSLSASVRAQDQMVTLKVEGMPFTKVISELKRQTQLDFFYSFDEVDVNQAISLDVKDAKVDEVLRQMLGRRFSWEYIDKMVIIKPTVGEDEPEKKSVRVRGFVYDEKKVPLPGVTVKVVGVPLGTSTNVRGWFSIELPMQKGKLEFSFVGYKKQQIDFSGSTDTLRVVLQEDLQEMEEVVVTGIFNRPKESFTGAVTAISREELKTHYSRNLIHTLANLDPSLRLIENNAQGSNPNALPEIQLRGASTLRSTDDIRNNESNYELNQPLFIMDGFEVSLERVMDLNDNEIENITILKDASATALYGSRGANGVIVITTLRPKSGKIMVSYQGKIKIEVPELSSYDDLTNAKEKLELERVYGIWDDSNLQEQYRELKDAVDSGLNYNWLDEPLRTGIGQQHVLNIMGGSEAWRFSLALMYDATIGVMKGSDRKNFNGSMSFDYVHGKWNVRQLLTIGKNKNQDSPYGLYSNYVKMNRYWTPYDEDGTLIEEYVHPMKSQYVIDNPMYDKEVGCWNESKYTSLRSTTQARYQISPSFQVTAMLGLTWKFGIQDSFIPPTHKWFADEENMEQKGKYSRGEKTESLWETRVTLNYAKTFNDRHMLTIGLSGEMSETVDDRVSWSATGFLTSEVNHLATSLGYPSTGGTYGYESTSRRISFGGFCNYYYDSRYFLDLTYRMDGGSSFGKNSRFSSYYAIGAGWTISKEEYVMEYLPFVSDWSVRYSYGVSGNMAFSPEQSMEVFKRDANYTYNGNLGVMMSAFANPNLKQQNTFQHNVGMNLGFFNNKIAIVLNYYTKLTDNTLTDIYLPISHGFDKVSGNVGEIRNTGYDGSVIVKLVGTKKWDWSISGKFSHNKSKLVKLSEGFKNTLELYDKSLSSASTYLRYREGYSMTAVYGLRTIGVDPLSGQRIFLSKDGQMTLYQSGEDLVYLGDTEPKVNGSLFTTLSYEGLSVSLGFGFQWGGVAENYTELNKRENLDLTYNVDRQVLKDGWQKIGDEALYKKQGYNVMNTYPCDMFIHKNNIFTCNSINVRYNFPKRWTKKLGMEMLSISTELSDIFYFSTIHRERGTSYPYSINPNLSISCTF